jgi:type IX secretion system PorP/SprF family membrane protein
MKKYLISLLLAAGLAGSVKAQDPHFSQYYAAPLTLNPANAGFFDGDARFSINERQQWWNVGYNYNTTSLSADVKLFKQQIPEFDTFALGFAGIFDNSSNGALQSNYISVSGAYHKSLAYNGSQTLALGVQLSYTNRHFDYNKLTFASQYTGLGFDATIPVDVNYNNTMVSYPDMHIGLLYAAHLPNANLYAGVSLYHILRPNESINNDLSVRLPIRKAIHAGGEVNLGAVSSVLFSGYYMDQDGAKDRILGGAYCLKMNNSYSQILNLYFGMWYRLSDSYIPYLGMDYENLNVGVNYGLPSSSQLNFRPNTFEVSLTYKIHSNLKTALCPRF